MTVEIIITFILCIATIVIVWSISRKQSKLDPMLLEWIKSMQDGISNNSTNMTKILQENSKQLNERLDRAAEVIRDVTREVGKMSEIGRSMDDLQHYLKNPKLRGNIGEEVLKDLISQTFPKNTFSLQYTFKSGEKVDAAIKTDAGILPIDAKFPMENFQRMSKHNIDSDEYISSQKEFIHDIKKHIDVISKKYILPDEGTMDFALMYVPSESVYYEIINTEEIIAYARRKRVYIVSPSTLYAHLQTILLSFEGKKIELRSREIFQLLRALQIDYTKVNDSLDILGKHLNNATNQYAQVNKGFNQIGNKLSSTKQLED